MMRHVNEHKLSFARKQSQKAFIVAGLRYRIAWWFTCAASSIAINKKTERLKRKATNNSLGSRTLWRRADPGKL